MDKNGDGTITPDELGTVMKSVRQGLTDDNIKEMFDRVDADGDGKIDYDECLRRLGVMMSRKKKATDSDQA